MSFQCEEFRSPQSIFLEKPVEDPAFIQESRAQFKQILENKDSRFALILGPCSIDNPAAALDYAKRIADLQSHIDSQFYLVMRVYLEKPRTGLGWTGFLSEPNHTFDPLQGILQARDLLNAINRLKVPIASEFVSPFTAPYISDLVTWGCIGARTSCSTIHRQLAAISQMPIGFKNSLEGCMRAAVHGMNVARQPQRVMGLNTLGQVALIQTAGNPDCHLVLRGGTLTGPNYDIPSIKLALQTLENFNLPTRLLIDCSHHNSLKNPENQKGVFKTLMSYREKGINSIFGCMLESYLLSGNQTEPLNYGQSLTDPCLGWDETKKLILSFAQCSV